MLGSSQLLDQNGELQGNCSHYISFCSSALSLTNMTSSHKNENLMMEMKLENFMYFAPDHLDRADVLNRAYVTWSNLPQFNPFPGKDDYLELYEDLKEHEDEWFGLLDRPAHHHRTAERIVVILGTLATIYRQGGSVQEAIEVLALDGKFLKRYKEMEASMGSSFPWPGHADELNFRYQGIRFHANMELMNDRDALTESYRELCDYEIRNNCCGNPGGATGQAAFMIPYVLGDGCRPLTLNKLKKLTDDDLYRVVTKGMKLELETRKKEGDERDYKRTTPLELGRCSLPTCGKMEDALGKFKRCSRCKEALYCCREHQKDHWKVHKRSCNR